jgi:hypothetical protein
MKRRLRLGFNNREKMGRNEKNAANHKKHLHVGARSRQLLVLKSAIEDSTAIREK